jgi:hypothetical protein
MAELCDSHAIPDALFRPMLREGKGAAISAVDDESTPISRTSDTWSTDQLCSKCESLLNEEYDEYGIGLFKGKKGRARQVPDGVCLEEMDSGRLRMFLLSVLWRMSTSTHTSYLNADLPSPIREELRVALLARKRYSGSRLQVSLERLHDSTKEGGFSSEQFRQVVMSPFTRQYETYYAVCFLMFGFLVQVFVPSLPSKDRRSRNLIPTNANRVFAPRLEFTRFPELFSVGVRSVYKSLNGLSNLPDA